MLDAYIVFFYIFNLLRTYQPDLTPIGYPLQTYSIIKHDQQ